MRSGFGPRSTAERGFTLIEMVMAIVLIAIVAGIAATVILQGLQAYSQEDTREDLLSQGRLAVERMIREIRQVRQASDIATFTASDFCFTDRQGNTVRFYFNNGTLYRGTGCGGTDAVLATDLSGVTFSYLDKNGNTATAASDIWVIQVDVNFLKAGEPLNLRFRVHPRGFVS